MIALHLQLQNQAQLKQNEMACLIDNALSPPQQQNHSLGFLSSQSLKFVRMLFKNNPLQKYEKVVRSQPQANGITVHVLYESIGNFQCVAEIQYDPEMPKCGVKMTVLRKERQFKVNSKHKIDAFCRLLQKYNLHLAHQNIQFAIDTSNGQIIVRHTLVQQIELSQESVKIVHENAARILRLVNQQMIFLIQCVDQNFQWEIYSKDSRYLQKIIAQSNDTLKIRELIALSYISFKDGSDNGQAKYSRNKELINFLSHRESMTNPALKKQCFIGPQLPLYCHFMEPQYFDNHPISLNTLQNDFVQEFNALFYNFQPKKMVNGDNPYLFNTILIKNEEKVKLKDVDCQGGFSRIEVAEVEIAYTESQNLVFDVPRAMSKNAKQSDASPATVKTCEKITYIPKVIAIKICKSESDYEKIKHQRIIVQNFRTTTSPFILKYYNCTQRGFKYRQYLLMDYMGSNPTLLQYNQLHRSSFSLQFKMHIFIHISNALNFLEKQQVVHMDLSSHNVMVSRDLLVKIIDFGEAYHPYIDTDKTIKYNPGHTMPYCPPETFNRIKKFSPKSDAFSLGVILFRVLFNDFPFASTSELKQSFINKSYLSRCMLAPERLADFGYQTQMMLMLQLIMRCLSPVQSNRPNAFWMYAILNKIFLTFK